MPPSLKTTALSATCAQKVSFRCCSDQQKDECGPFTPKLTGHGLQALQQSVQGVAVKKTISELEGGLISLHASTPRPLQCMWRSKHAVQLQLTTTAPGARCGSAARR